MKKPSKRLVTVIAVVALIIFALCVAHSRGKDAHTGLDTAGKQACDDFAAGYPKASTKPDRLALADQVTKSSGKTDNKEIQERAAEMGQAASAGGSQWKTAAQNLSTACKNAGWTAP
ncbi:hypothetical protein ODJ79_36710 [Actinoplanes sp. KI2]|uniref:hypothetical protein n=1 Tax=Actinoplanes sp. KI2 TaxID=2983315 RepID=UPI0021D5FD33|nr:hypothetical protein [Actinoplanes sp. KI2]MCU7729289.1 hypothetical protein [Actinoplanes sp. KI2]